MDSESTAATNTKQEGFSLLNNKERKGKNKGTFVSRLARSRNPLAAFALPYIRYRDVFILFIPAIAFYIIFKYIPMYGVLIAFKDFRLGDGFAGSNWVGFKHFIKLFNSAPFWEVFRNTIEISFMRILFGFPAPILLAIFINEVTSTKFKRAIQTVSYLPHFLSWVVMASMFTQVLSPSTGIVNILLKTIGISPIYFMGDPHWFRFTLISTGIWASVGWSSIIYIAAITGIDPQLYEAALVDGANRFKRIWHITLPSVAPVVTITLILSTGSIINGGFDQIFNMYNDAVMKVSDIIDTYVYRKGLVGMEYSYSAAIGLFKNLISVVMITITNLIARRVNDYGIW